MKRMTAAQMKEALTNSLRSFNFPEHYSINTADARAGKLFAIVTHIESSAIKMQTQYMSYDEMNAFFAGYNFCKRKNLIP